MLLPPIGIFGGTFDPIHLGHLRLALELYEMMHLAVIHVIPCYQPVHRASPIASPQQRLAMVKAACVDEPALVINNCEIRRKGPSYCIDTLFFFRQTFPKVPLCLLVGIDTFLGFGQWYRWEEIFNLAHIVVAHRPSYPVPTEGLIAELLTAYLQQDMTCIHTMLASHIVLCPMTQLNISSTDIRQRIAKRSNPRYLLPDKVHYYIREHNIYAPNP